MVYTARSSRTWAGLLVCLRKVSPCSPVVLCLVRSSGACGCPCPRWSGPALPSTFSLSRKLSFLACKFLACSSVCLPPHYGMVACPCRLGSASFLVITLCAEFLAC
ncbi:hypothetical protein V6N13_032121 [Hibiscus sabdariffa]|uniref:Secreted protein n=1 Tax=Hibiscus sabdariffa TaxID=183260 RepID=A0ABR2A1U8_9ROSI